MVLTVLFQNNFTTLNDAKFRTENCTFCCETLRFFDRFLVPSGVFNKHVTNITETDDEYDEEEAALTVHFPRFQRVEQP